MNRKNQLNYDNFIILKSIEEWWASPVNGIFVSFQENRFYQIRRLLRLILNVSLYFWIDPMITFTFFWSLLKLNPVLRQIFIKPMKKLSGLNIVIDNNNYHPLSYYLISMKYYQQPQFMIKGEQIFWWVYHST